MDDLELVHLAARGDAGAFDDLVRRHSGDAWRLARAILRDDFHADEATQDTFLKAHRALESFRGEASVKTWLLAICRRVCLDRLRLRTPRSEPLVDVPQEPAQERVEFWISLQQAMDELSPEERESFYLVDVLGHSREDAAGIVGAPASTVRSRVARARERLASTLAEGEGVA